MDSKILAELKSAAAQPARPASPDPESSVNPSASIVSETDALQGADSAKNTLLSGASGASATPETPTPAANGLPGASTGVSSVPNPTARPIQIGSIVGGKFAVDLIDMLIPAVAVYLFNALGYELEKRGMQLTEREKAVIAPAMQDYLNSIQVNLNNPLYNLLLVIGVTYGSKLIEVLPKTKKRAKAKEKPVAETVEEKAEEVKEKMQENEEKKTKIQIFRDSLAQVEKHVALKMIEDMRKKGKQDAVAYYHKYVTQNRKA